MSLVFVANKWLYLLTFHEISLSHVDLGSSCGLLVLEEWLFHLFFVLRNGFLWRFEKYPCHTLTLTVLLCCSGPM